LSTLRACDGITGLIESFFERFVHENEQFRTYWTHLSQENVVNWLAKLHTAHHVVGQVCQADLGLCSFNADGSDIHGLHRVGHEPEDMFDPATKA